MDYSALMDHLIKFMIHDGIPFTGFILSFFIVIAFHEYGHYLFARRHGVRVHCVDVGYGRKLFTWKDKLGTDWSVHLLPFVGAISLAGQQRISQTEITHKQEDANASAPLPSDLFHQKSIPVRLLIVIAGPMFNYILAFLMLAFLFASFGEPVRSPVITGVKLESSADISGIKVGDEILSVNGADIKSFYEVRQLIRQWQEGDVSLSLIIVREGQKVELQITPDIIEYKDTRRITRVHPQIGVLSQSLPISLKSIDHIDGRETGQKARKAREIALDSMGKDAVISIKTNDGEFTSYKIYLHPASNEKLNDPNSVHHDSLFLDKQIDNNVRTFTFSEAIDHAGYETWRLFSGVISMPYKAVPFDNTLIDPPASMTGIEHPFFFMIYKILFLGATVSIFLGTINLLPIPGFDGSRVISILADLLPNSEVIEPYLQRAAIILFLFTVVFANSLRVAAL